MATGRGTKVKVEEMIDSMRATCVLRATIRILVTHGNTRYPKTVNQIGIGTGSIYDPWILAVPRDFNTERTDVKLNWNQMTSLIPF